MSERFDVIVVGVGAMGSSACLHLAKRGVAVLGLEQFGIPHQMGSSHGESRIIRLCYYEHPDYVPLLRRAYELWAELEQESGQKLLHITGGIYMGAPDCEFVAGALRAANQHGLPHEALDRREVARRYPQFHLPDDYVGLYEPNAGFLLPEKVVATNAELALKYGAVLHGHEPVLNWSSSNDGVQVRTARGNYVAQHLIFCGGAWSEKLLGELGVKLVVTRQVLGWVQPKRPQKFALGILPVWAIDRGDNTQYYGFPIHHGRPGFKLAHHFHGAPTTPETINRIPLPEDENDFRPALTRYIPDADGPLLSMAICMYTNSPDSHFIIDHYPGLVGTSPNVTIACGFSGHGFKFASVIGEVLADLALNGKTHHPIGFLGLQRFASSAGR